MPFFCRLLAPFKSLIVILTDSFTYKIHNTNNKLCFYKTLLR